MKLSLVCLSVALLSTSVKAQKNLVALTEPIVEEGNRLFNSEHASWLATDLFLEKYPDRKKVKGYFSYAVPHGENCIFFSSDSISDSAMVIGTVHYDSGFTATGICDLSVRKFSPIEEDIYQMRVAALRLINSDTNFIRYPEMQFNLVPLIAGAERKLYVLTGPQKNGVVVFGNDYLIRFDASNKVISEKRLHNNIITINYGKEEGGEEAEATMHSHKGETGNFITATDICTLMLYEKFTKWKSHYVMSKDFVSIWNCQTDNLFPMTMNAFKKIGKN